MAIFSKELHKCFFHNRKSSVYCHFVKSHAFLLVTRHYCHAFFSIDSSIQQNFWQSTGHLCFVYFHVFSFNLTRHCLFPRLFVYLHCSLSISTPLMYRYWRDILSIATFCLLTRHLVSFHAFSFYWHDNAYSYAFDVLPRHYVYCSISWSTGTTLRLFARLFILLTRQCLFLRLWCTDATFRLLQHLLVHWYATSSICTSFYLIDTTMPIYTPLMYFFGLLTRHFVYFHVLSLSTRWNLTKTRR